MSGRHGKGKLPVPLTMFRWADTSSPQARSYDELVLLFQRAINTANGLPNKAVAAGQTDIDAKLDMSTNQSRTKVLKVIHFF